MPGDHFVHEVRELAISREHRRSDGLACLQWTKQHADDGLRGEAMRGHVLSADDRERRWIINRIMCHSEVRASEFEQVFGRRFVEAYRAELESLTPAIEDGLVTRDEDGSLVVTPLGRLLLRNVAMVFDAYLAEQRQTGKPLFSKTV